MLMLPLQSGSSGNCVFVEAAGVRLLIDAGVSGVQAERRLAAAGVDIRTVDALLVSHDHSDHVRCAGIFQRKYEIPILATAKTLDAAERWKPLGRLFDVRPFASGDTVRVGRVSIETVPTPHDAADGVGFVVDDGKRRLGILTDLGHVFDGLADVIASLDAVLLESNHDEAMLEGGPYPAFLKRRIRGPAGHISNAEAAVLLRGAARGGMAWACLGHLSGENNTPELALGTHRDLGLPGLPLHVASRDAAGPILKVE
jgi:phosphoribosyl 1,2-cyclic phosphodiesterase